jgi:hypothetical protein
MSPRARIHEFETSNLLVGSAATAIFFGRGADGPALRLVCPLLCDFATLSMTATVRRALA